MKPIKVFFNGKRLKDIYPHATRYQLFKYRLARFFRKLTITTLTAIILILAFQLGGIFNPTLTYQRVEAIKEVEKESPVLDRISMCESTSSHYDKNGQVLIRPNTNGTVDIGEYQINSVWFKKATELGLDLTKPQDNKAMAMWIYKNRGTGDWSSSSKCWNK